MDWATIKLLSGIIVAIFTVLGLYATWKDSQNSKKSTKEYNISANQKREEIRGKIDASSEKMSEVEKALTNLDYIGMTTVQDLKDRYPYGYVLFGKLENRLLLNGSSIRDNSLNFSADWERTELSYDGEKDPYHFYLTLYDVFHSNHTDKNALDYKGFNAPKSKVNVPIYKDQTPVDITFIKYYDEPHMYYEILENFDGEDMVFLLGFKKIESMMKNIKRQTLKFKKEK